MKPEPQAPAVIARSPRYFLWLSVVVAMCLPGQVSADFKSRTNQRVLPTIVDGAQMEVFSTAGAAAPDYFCTASQYALRRLAAHPSDRVVVVRPLAPSTTDPRFQSVLFAVQPWEEYRSRNGSIVASVGRVGTSYSNAVGLRWCRKSPLAR